MRTRVKICGLRREKDAHLAAELGADFLGFVFAPSPRQADPNDLETWLPDLAETFPDVIRVGVFVDPDLSFLRDTVNRLSLEMVQLHQSALGDADLDVPWIATSRPGTVLDEAREREGNKNPPYAWLVDTPSSVLAGGTGRVFDWGRLPTPSERGDLRLFLAGGLCPSNVASAIRIVSPDAVDASSRLESEPGIKDPVVLRAYFDAIGTQNDPTRGNADQNHTN